MKLREALFDLIQSMTPAERRHFKLNARRYSPSGHEKKYVLFFDAVAAQKDYDEPLLRRTLAAEIPETSFTSWKRHLLKYVEITIREFHAGKDNTEAVYEALRDAELMYRRGLWDNARRKIAASKDIAERLGDLLALLKINETERRLALEFEVKFVEEKIETLRAEAANIMSMLQTDQAYSEIFERTCLLVRLKFDPRNPQVIAQVPILLQDDRLQQRASFPSFRSQRYFHQARAFLYHLANKPEQEYEEYLALLKHWDDNPYFKAVFPKMYKFALTNFLHVLIKLGKWDACPSVFAAVEKLGAENNDEAAEDFQTIEFYRHLFFLDSRQLKSAIKMLPTLEKGLVRFAAKINHARWLSFKVNMAITLFLSGEAKAAQHQIEQILSHPKSEHRSDAQTLARILEPVLIYDLGEAQLAFQKLHALREWLRTNERFYDFERMLLSKMELLFNAAASKQAEVLGGFKAELRKIHLQGQIIPGADLLLLWAEAKQARKSLRDVFEVSSPTDI